MSRGRLLAQGVWQLSPWCAVGLQMAGRSQAPCEQGLLLLRVTATPSGRAEGQGAGADRLRVRSEQALFPPSVCPPHHQGHSALMVSNSRARGSQPVPGAGLPCAWRALGWSRQPVGAPGSVPPSASAPSLVTAALLRSEAEPGLS